eukprot:jgi/Mesvir1/17867/Mv12944-RA.1
MGIEPAPADASKTFPQQDQYNQWMASMQGYYNSQMGPGGMPPAGFMPPSMPASSSGGGHPYMWGPQGMMPPYPPPLPGMSMSMPGGFPGMFPGGMFPHPPMPPASGQGEDAGGRGRVDNGSAAGPPLGSGGAMAPPRGGSSDGEPRNMPLYGMPPSSGAGGGSGPLSDMHHAGNRSPEHGGPAGGAGGSSQKVVARKPSSSGADLSALGKGSGGLTSLLNSAGGGADGLIHEPQPSRLSPPSGDTAAPAAIKPHAQSHLAQPHSVYRPGLSGLMGNGGVGVPTPGGSMGSLGGVPPHTLGAAGSGNHLKGYDKPRAAVPGSAGAAQGPAGLSGNVRDHQGRLKKDPACQPSSNYENSSDWENSSDSQEERKVSVGHRRGPGEGYAGATDAGAMDLRRSISGDSKQTLSAIACDGAELWGLQDEREVKRQRRKQSNRESARRSRLRKQAECEELGSRVESLTMENMHLRDELRQLHTTCNVLGSENALLQEQLRKIRFPVPASGDNPSAVSTPALASVTMPLAEPAASVEGSAGASPAAAKDAKEHDTSSDKPSGTDGADAAVEGQSKKPKGEGERDGEPAHDSASSVPATKRSAEGAGEAEPPTEGADAQGAVAQEHPEGKAKAAKKEDTQQECAAVPAETKPRHDSPEAADKSKGEQPRHHLQIDRRRASRALLGMKSFFEKYVQEKISPTACRR